MQVARPSDLGQHGNSGFQQFQGDGIRVSSSCVISGNLAAENRLAGLVADFGFGSTTIRDRTLFLGNIVRGNNSAGIRPESLSVVVGNVVEGNTSIFSDGVQPRVGTLVTGNAIHDNGGTGIDHFGNAGAATSLAATNNAVTENTGGGIRLSNSDDGALIVRNTFRSNAGGNQVGTCTNCTIVNNRF